MRLDPSMLSVPIVLALIGAVLAGVTNCGSPQNLQAITSDAGVSEGASPESCVPTTCAAAGATCGAVPDGCNGTLACGNCATGMTCGAAGPDKCGIGTCTPATCEGLRGGCGPQSDGCGGILQCSPCGGVSDAGCAAGAFTVITPPGQVPLSSKFSTTFTNNLVPTSSGFLLLSQTNVAPGNTLLVLPVATNETLGALQTITTPVDQAIVPSVAAGCGGLVAVGYDGQAGSSTAYFMLLKPDGTQLQAPTALTIPSGSSGLSVMTVDGATVYVNALEQGMQMLDCSGAVTGSVSLATMMGGTACPVAAQLGCGLRGCIREPGGMLLCTVSELGFPDNVTTRWNVVLSASGQVISGPHEVLSGVSGDLYVTSCSSSSCSGFFTSASGLFRMTFDLSGAVTGPMPRLNTTHAVIRPEIVESGGVLAILTSNNPSVLTLYPSDIFLFDDATLAPLLSDPIGNARPVPLPPILGDCDQQGVVAMGVTAAGGIILNLDTYTNGGVCTPTTSVVWLSACH